MRTLLAAVSSKTTKMTKIPKKRSRKRLKMGTMRRETSKCSATSLVLFSLTVSGNPDGRTANHQLENQSLLPKRLKMRMRRNLQRAESPNQTR